MKLRFLLPLLALSVSASAAIKIISKQDDQRGINLNFSDISKELSNTVHKTSTETVRGNKTFGGCAPWVDVSVFGARNDGTTISGTAINNAFSQCSGGGIIRFGPGGTYVINGDLSLNTSSITLLGVGMPRIRQTGTGTSGYNVVIGPGVTNVTIDGLVFETDATTAGQGDNIGINVGDSSNKPKRIKIQNCYFGPQSNVIGIGGGRADDIQIINNVFDMGSQAQHAMYLTRMTKLLISGNRVTGPGAGAPTFPGSVGIKIIGTVGASVINNEISNWKDDGILVQQQAGTEKNENTVIVGNRIDNVNAGIVVNDSSNTLISANLLTNCSDYGMVVSGTNSVVTGNILRNVGIASSADQEGILAGGMNLSLTGNIISDFAFAGIEIGGQTTGYVNITGNSLLGASAARGITINSASFSTGTIVGNTIRGVTSEIINGGGRTYFLRANSNATTFLNDSSMAVDGFVTIGTSGVTNSTFTIINGFTSVGAAVGTLNNAPSAGNPVGYLSVNINGTNRKIPYW